jgi:hypothetical protein
VHVRRAEVVVKGEGEEEKTKEDRGRNKKWSRSSRCRCRSRSTGQAVVKGEKERTGKCWRCSVTEVWNPEEQPTCKKNGLEWWIVGTGR